MFVFTFYFFNDAKGLRPMPMGQSGGPLGGGGGPGGGGFPDGPGGGPGGLSLDGGDEDDDLIVVVRPTRPTSLRRLLRRATVASR